MASVALKTPGTVSPLIRAARYVAVFSGIAYGYSKRKRYEKKEAIRMEREDVIRRRKAERARKLAAEADKANMVYLARDVGLVPKEKEWADLYKKLVTDKE